MGNVSVESVSAGNSSSAAVLAYSTPITAGADAVSAGGRCRLALRGGQVPQGRDVGHGLRPLGAAGVASTERVARRARQRARTSRPRNGARQQRSNVGPTGFASSSTRRNHPRSESCVDGTDGAPEPSCADAGRLPAVSASFHWLGAISGCGEDFSSSGRPSGAPLALDSTVRHQPPLGGALLVRSCSHGAGCWLRARLAAYPPRSGLQWPQHHRASSRQPQE